MEQYGYILLKFQFDLFRQLYDFTLSSCSVIAEHYIYIFLRGYQQQDAHEFMRYLLDRLHTELLTLLPYPNRDSPYIGAKDKSTIVTAIFGGILQSEVTCLICGTNSKKHDPFLGK